MDQTAQPLVPDYRQDPIANVVQQEQVDRLSDVSSNQWKSGIAAWLGWLFDGLDMHLYTLVAAPFVAQLLGVLSPSDPAVREKSALIQAAFLVGWALGGGFFGRLGDIFGRSRALGLTILTYAVFTGLSFFAHQWWHLLIFRFLAALGIGGEWAVGSSLLAETWPRKWQVWIAAILQTGVNIGVLLACLAVYALAGQPERYVFLVGILPALLVFWIRRSVGEPEQWHAARLSADRVPSWVELFQGDVRRTTILTILVCASSLTAWWAFMFWHVQHLRGLPDVVNWSDAEKSRLVSAAFFLVIGVSIAGNFFASLLARLFGYRKAIAMMCVGFFVAMFGTYCIPRDHVSILRWIPWVGFFSGVFGLFTMYLPPLFPVLLRTTGAGFSYNIGRIAAAFGTIFFVLVIKVPDLRMALLIDAFLFIPAMIVVMFMPDIKQNPSATCAFPADKMNRQSILVLMCLLGSSLSSAWGQSEVTGWGSLRGIRVNDQLIPFTTAVGIYNPDFTQLTLSQREGPTRTSTYTRDGDAVTVGITLQYGGRGGRGNGAGQVARGAPAISPATTTAARGQGAAGGRGPAGNSVDYTLTYKDIRPGECEVKVRLASIAAQSIGGSYYFLTFPASAFTNPTAELLNRPGSTQAKRLDVPDEQGRYLAGRATGIRISTGNNRKIEIRVPQALDFVMQQSRGRNNADIQVYFPIVVGDLGAGQNVEASFTIVASGDADTSPVVVTVDPSKLGRAFLGIGGNYRIQNQRLDPLHFNYIFDHMRVAYGRVAMPWNTWQPQEDAPPPFMAGTGQTPVAGGRGGGGAMNSVPLAMEMAQTLATKKIPMIISCWSPPAWAVLPQGNGGQRGQRLDPAKYDAICQSIGSYLIYLRDHYGAEPLLFSFNESDAGINVRQSPEEHAEAIKRLGAHFKAMGLKTRMLLGDTGDVPPVDFIQPAINDLQAVPFIGAISFHSWRGATDQQYQRWADAAARLNVPLFDAEGGNDAQAYSYPNLFREPWYALDEAAEYVRIMRICQPLSILQWQFTENYSVLYADPTGVLHPTQRFFNLKQFNLTPPGAAWMAAESSSDLVHVAGLFDPTSKSCALHLLNNGAARPITIKGLPESVTSLKVYVTDHNRSMEGQEPVTVHGGVASITLPPTGLITLISGTDAR